MWRRPALDCMDRMTEVHEDISVFWTTRGWLLPHMRGFLQEDFKSKLPTWQHILQYFTNKKIITSCSRHSKVYLWRRAYWCSDNAKQKHLYDCLNICLMSCVNVCVFCYTHTVPASFVITSLSTFNCVTYLEWGFLVYVLFQVHLVKCWSTTLTTTLN